MTGALYGFMKEKGRELKERKQEREAATRRRIRHRTGSQELRRIRLSEDEKRKLRAKIVG